MSSGDGGNRPREGGALSGPSGKRHLAGDISLMPLRGPRGWQARIGWRALGVSSGPHVLEIRDICFKDWRFELDVEPGLIRKIHATLIPRL